jgi:hypothetical protein
MRKTGLAMLMHGQQVSASATGSGKLTGRQQQRVAGLQCSWQLNDGLRSKFEAQSCVDVTGPCSSAPGMDQVGDGVVQLQQQVAGTGLLYLLCVHACSRCHTFNFPLT